MRPADEIVQSETYNGGTVQIHLDQDGYASNPREWCNVTRFAFPKSNRYEMPNEIGFDFDAYDYREGGPCIIEPGMSAEDADDCTMHDHEQSNEAEAEWAERVLREDYGALFVLPASMHGEDGYVIVTQEGVDETGCPPELFEQACRDDLAQYKAWANGDVYGWVALDDHGDEIESCWGYVGDDEWDYMLSEARNAVDGWAENRERTANDIAADAMAELLATGAAS